MLSNFLVSHLIKNYNNLQDSEVRKAYGYVGSAVGFAANFILFLIKLLVGIFTNSIAVVADAFSTLSDAVSFVITLVGLRLSLRYPDKKHPFGYGRMEYISGMFICIIVILAGVELTRTSFNRVLHPMQVHFNITLFILILLSISVKFWLSAFEGKIAKAIGSSSIKATSLDAINDGIASCCVALSLLMSKFITFSLDGYIGMLVAIFIFYSGCNMIKDILSTLLGKAPTSEMVQAIRESILSYEGIIGIHDLMVHDYGPGRCAVSLHVEVPYTISIAKMHELIDSAEREISKKLNIFLVIHIDPINTNDKEVLSTKKVTEDVLKKFPIIQSMHDFRIVGEGEYKSLIFDVVISYREKLTPRDEKKLMDDIDLEIKKIHPKYQTVIFLDRDFSEV